MSEFSTLVYKKGGAHHAPGGTYDYKQAKSQEEYDALIKGDYFATLPEALEGKSEPKPKDESQPSRDEAKTKADELGIKYAANIPTKKLVILINEKIAANKETE